MYHGIIFTECTSQNWLGRGYGVHRLANELRKYGFKILVVDFAFAVDFDIYKRILDKAIGDETYFVGFSTSIFPYRMQDVEGQKKASLLQHSYARESAEQFLKLENEPWYCAGLPMQFANGLTEPWFEYIKKCNRKTKIIFGGSKTWEYFETPGIDHFFIGMAETMFVDYMLSVSGKGPKRIFNTIIDYDIKAQGNKALFDFKSSTTKYEPEDFIMPYEALGLEVGRGCRFSCSFCTWPLIGQKNINEYLKTPEILRAELIENWEKWGVWKYYVTDDTFNDSTEKLEAFYSVVKSLPFKPVFWGFFRLDLLRAHPEQIPLVRDCGFKDIIVGLETFHPTAGKNIKKGGKADNLKQALIDCKNEWGDDVMISSQFITGLPGEDSSSIRYSTEWFLRDDAPINAIGLVPLRLYAPDRWEKYRVTSEFERNYKKYGYSFPDPVNRPWYWEKDDGTDIRNYDEAKSIANECEKQLKSAKRSGKWIFKHTKFSGDDITVEKLDSLTYDEYRKIPMVSGNMLLVKKQVMEDYINPLLSFLENGR